MKIKQWGFEVEYPFVRECWEIEEDVEDVEILDYYGFHDDCGGCEFSTPIPLSYGDLKLEINKIYVVIDNLNEDVDKSMMYGVDVGVHIRIEPDGWTDQEILRFGRLFSRDMEPYSDYIQWLERQGRRPLYNWNSPVRYNGDYDSWYRAHNMKRTTNKGQNLRYEWERFTDGLTIEVRLFGVPETPEECHAYMDFIILMTDIVKLSIIKGDDSPVINLYNAWKEIVNK